MQLLGEGGHASVIDALFVAGRSWPGDPSAFYLYEE
jgi:hypothetical protein